MQPFPGAQPPQIVGRDLSALGFNYDVMPYTGRTAGLMPSTWFDRGQLVRGTTPVRQLPWTPYSYPSVGREPHQFVPPDVPATPAVQGVGMMSDRKASLGRVVAAGRPGTAPGYVVG